MKIIDAVNSNNLPDFVLWVVKLSDVIGALSARRISPFGWPSEPMSVLRHSDLNCLITKEQA